MKKKMIMISIIVLMITLIAGCGSKDKTVAEVSNTKEAETKKVETDTYVDVSVKTPTVSLGGWDDTEAWTIGPNADIEPLTGDLENGMPEFSMLLPSKSNNYTLEAINYEGNIRTNETSNLLIIDVTDTSRLKVYVEYWPLEKKSSTHDSMHYTDNICNQYTLDVDWIEDIEHPGFVTYTITNKETGCAVLVKYYLIGKEDLNTKEGTTDKDKTDYNNFVKTTAEYLSKQLELLPTDYTPVVVSSATSSTDEEISEVETVPEISPQVWDDEAIALRQDFIDSYYRTYTSDNGITLELIYNDDNDSALISDGMSTYECSLIEIGEGTYAVYLDGKNIAELYNDEPDVFQFYSLTEEFKYLNGYYN